MELEESSHIKIAVRNYLVILFFCIAVFGLSYMQGLAPQLALLKALLIPIFWLAYKGPDFLFKSPVYEGRLTVRAIEYSLIKAYIISTFGLLLNVRPGIDNWQIFYLCVLLIPVLTVVMVAAGIKRTAA